VNRNDPLAGPRSPVGSLAAHPVRLVPVGVDVGLAVKLLDLFCGAGGAAMGYAQAGFTEIVGVDIEPQPNYPFEFIQADALLFLKTRAAQFLGFDLIHTSPPCQASTPMGNRWQNPRWPDLIPQTRELLERSGVPYVIENVVGAPLHDPLMLTGEMFGLSTSRPRLFELGGWFAMSPPKMRRQADAVAVYGKADGRRLWTRSDGSELRAWTSIEEGREALGVPWMQTELEIREAIPPAFTRYMGEQFLAQVPA
jgi:DNA (cytosine-5)-methyltransferase 1